MPEHLYGRSGAGSTASPLPRPAAAVVARVDACAPVGRVVLERLRDLWPPATEIPPAFAEPVL